MATYEKRDEIPDWMATYGKRGMPLARWSSMLHGIPHELLFNNNTLDNSSNRNNK